MRREVEGSAARWPEEFEEEGRWRDMAGLREETRGSVVRW